MSDNHLYNVEIMNENREEALSSYKIYKQFGDVAEKNFAITTYAFVT